MKTNWRAEMRGASRGGGGRRCVERPCQPLGPSYFRDGLCLAVTLLWGPGRPYPWTGALAVRSSRHLSEYRCHHPGTESVLQRMSAAPGRPTGRPAVRGVDVLTSPWARGRPVLNPGRPAVGRHAGHRMPVLTALRLPHARPGPSCAEGFVRGQVCFSGVRPLPALFLRVCGDQAGARSLPERRPPRLAVLPGRRPPSHARLLRQRPGHTGRFSGAAPGRGGTPTFCLEVATEGHTETQGTVGPRPVQGEALFLKQAGGPALSCPWAGRWSPAPASPRAGGPAAQPAEASLSRGPGQPTAPSSARLPAPHTGRGAPR